MASSGAASSNAVTLSRSVLAHQDLTGLLDAELHVDRLPEKRERHVRHRADLFCFAAVAVRVEAKAVGIGLLHEHEAHARMARGGAV